MKLLLVAVETHAPRVETHAPRGQLAPLPESPPPLAVSSNTWRSMVRWYTLRQTTRSTRLWCTLLRQLMAAVAVAEAMTVMTVAMA